MDFALEKRLKELDPGLHKRFTDTVFVMQQTLGQFVRLFPTFTDHSIFHTLNVAEFCNSLIGPRQLEKLNKDEIYVLLMACYLHDSGMSITQKDYDEFKDELGAEEYFAQMPDATVADFVREKHHEFSGKFIEKYAEMLEIPTEEMVFAVKQVSRGHRRTDLLDPDEYPEALDMKDGLTVCTPYLASLVRLADEIDVVTDRNPKLLYDIEALTDEKDILHYSVLEAVESMDMSKDGFLLHACTDDPVVIAFLEKVIDKMQTTLDYCRSVTKARSGFRITQRWVRLQKEHE